MAGDSELLILTAATLMKTWVDTDAVKRFDPEYMLSTAFFGSSTNHGRPRTGRANLVRNTMTQAILFGSYTEVNAPDEFGLTSITYA